MYIKITNPENDKIKYTQDLSFLCEQGITFIDNNNFAMTKFNQKLKIEFVKEVE